jgi:hypothetical protein
MTKTTRPFARRRLSGGMPYFFNYNINICQKLGAVGLTALGRAQLCPAVAGGALLRLSLPGPRHSLRDICPYGACLVNVSTVGAAPRSTQAFTAHLFTAC